MKNRIDILTAMRDQISGYMGGLTGWIKFGLAKIFLTKGAARLSNEIKDALRNNDSAALESHFGDAFADLFQSSRKYEEIKKLIARHLMKHAGLHKDFLTLLQGGLGKGIERDNLENVLRLLLADLNDEIEVEKARMLQSKENTSMNSSEEQHSKQELENHLKNLVFEILKCDDKILDTKVRNKDFLVSRLAWKTYMEEQGINIKTANAEEIFNVLQASTLQTFKDFCLQVSKSIQQNPSSFRGLLKDNETANVINTFSHEVS